MTPRSDRCAFVCGHTGGIALGEQSRCRAVDEVHPDPELTFGNPAYDRDNSLTGEDFRQYKSLVARHRANTPGHFDNPSACRRSLSVFVIVSFA